MMELAEEKARATSPWLPLAAVIATVSVYAIAQGLTYPLLSFILERQGHSPAAIGLSAAMTPLGFICCAPLVPWITRRFGAGRAIVASALLAAVMLALIGWTHALYPWFLLRFLIGMIVLPLYIVSEVWIIALAPPEKRGRVMGVYTSVISGGFALGPLTLTLVGTEGWPPFLVGVAAFLACGLCLIAVLPRMPNVDDGSQSASVRAFLPLAPLLLFAVFVVAALEQSSLSLLPVYGAAHGIGAREMSAMIAVWIAGNVALQVPIGLAVERWSAQSLLAASAAATAISCALVPLFVETPLVWPLMFVWGGVLFGIYTAALIALGNNFSGAMLVAGNSAFALMWGIGGIAGPSATGGVMTLVGPEGLPLVLGLLCVALVGVTLIRRQ
jgi:MFS family permease